jgi:hypothetical protein
MNKEVKNYFDAMTCVICALEEVRDKAAKNKDENIEAYAEATLNGLNVITLYSRKILKK